MCGNEEKGKERGSESASSAILISIFSIVILVLPTVPHFCIAYTQTLLFLVNESLTPDTPSPSHMCFHLFKHTETPNIFPLMSLNLQASSWTVTHISYYTYTHWPSWWMIPSGQSCQAETTSSCYSSFFGPSHSFINLLFLPLAPLTLTLVSCIFTDTPPDAVNPLASHF